MGPNATTHSEASDESFEPCVNTFVTRRVKGTNDPLHKEKFSNDKLKIAQSNIKFTVN